MSNNLISAYFQIASIIYTLVILISFFSKPKVKTIENKIFCYIIVENVIGLLLALICFYFSTYTTDMLMIELSLKLVFLIILLWIVTFTIYIYTISKKIIYEDKEKYQKFLNFKNISLLFYVISGILMLAFPVNIIETELGLYADPGSLSFLVVYVSIGLYSLEWWKFFFVKESKLERKFYPLYGFIVLGITSAVIQILYPYLALTVPVESFITILIYFIMENPDVKLVELERTEKDRALKLSESKTAFLDNMSKELRTPLASITGTSEDLTTFDVSNYPDGIAEDIKDIYNASNTLLEIIGNIMDISKIESGQIDIIPSDYNPKEEFESLAKMMRPKVAEKPIEFSVKISENLPQVLYGDRIRIKQVINNFLSNAIKYTEKGNVDFIVEWYDASQSLFIKVSDTGRGVKPEDIDRLFAKYDRVDVEKVSTVQGTGLGLAITKELIETMGGTINVESEYGKGTSFMVTLPQQLGNVEKYNQKKELNDNIINYNFTGKKILIVDDNQLIIKTFKKTLKTFNLIIDECYSAEEAIEKISLNTYDLIFSDIGMPEMSGEELLATLKQNPDFNIPVIALTAEAMNGARQKYLSLGFADYILKPVTKKEIGRKLYYYFNKNTN